MEPDAVDLGFLCEEFRATDVKDFLFEVLNILLNPTRSLFDLVKAVLRCGYLLLELGDASKISRIGFVLGAVGYLLNMAL